MVTLAAALLLFFGALIVGSVAGKEVLRDRAVSRHVSFIVRKS
jgi:hypothetical protein